MTDPARSQHRPANLYNGMIAPLAPFALRGAVWYQGESNQSRAFQYRTLLPTLIRSWREDWGQGSFPFYFVQIANYLEPKNEPGPSSWAEVREAQLLTMKNTPNTGMAVIVDIGEAGNIHPKNKQDVGRRLARWALARDYRKPVVPSGPVYLALFVEGEKAIVTFNLYGSKLAVRGQDSLRGFTLAGEDRKFVPARAEIRGDEVWLTAPGVDQAVAVRYGWADNPDANLTNTEGLPASPFRTDDWPGVTDDRVLPF